MFRSNASLLGLFIFVWSMLAVYACQSTSKPESDYFNQGNQYAKDGLLKEAILSYQNEVKENPKNFLAIRNLGIVHLKIGNYKKAIAYLKTSMKVYSADFPTNFYLAEAYRAKQELADAIYYYRRALEIQGDNTKALKALAWSYYQTRAYPEALRMTQNVREITPNDGQNAIIIARIQIKMGSYANALSNIEKALAFAPTDEVPYLNSVQGDIFAAMENCQKAMEAYRKALQQEPLLPGALLGLGRCMITSNENREQAISYIERATRLRPQLVEGYYLLGKYLEQSRPEEAISYYKHFKKVAAGNPEYKSYLMEVKKKISTYDAEGSKKSRSLR